MVKNHLKTITTPTTWSGVLRKANTFITRPLPGAHTLEQSMPVQEVIKQLGFATTRREVKTLLNTTKVLIDKKRVKEIKHQVGFMDTIEFENHHSSYTMILSEKGKLELKPTKTTDLKISKILGKHMIKGGKLQLQLSGGRTLTTDNNTLNIGDSIVITLPKQSIKKHLPQQKGATIILTGGKNRGHTGTIETVEGKELTYTTADNNTTKTLTNYAFVIDKEL